jgi:hypothetical protein
MKAAFTGGKGGDLRHPNNSNRRDLVPVSGMRGVPAILGARPALRFPRSPTGMFEQSFRKMVKPSQPPEWVLFCCKRERLGFIDAAPHGLTQLRQ